MLLSAKPYVEHKIKELKEQVDKLKIKPTLALIRVGNDPASIKYVNNKIKRCEEVGIKSQVHELPEHVDQKDVAKLIEKLNNDKTVTGILLQLPLPSHLDEHYLTNLIKASKDVDGFTITNTGKLSLGMDCNVACTPKGIIDLLKFYDIPIEGKDVLIISRSNIVGKPLVQLFLNENATVTVAHSKTKGLTAKVWHSDIVVTAVGKADFLSDRDFANGTTIVDVSINFNEEGKMCGDVTKADVDILQRRCNITPVPGGIGQCTVIALLENTIKIQQINEGEMFYEF